MVSSLLSGMTKTPMLNNTTLNFANVDSTLQILGIAIMYCNCLWQFSF